MTRTPLKVTRINAAINRPEILFIAQNQQTPQLAQILLQGQWNRYIALK